MQLYRHFDADGDLLYVGISLNHLQRLIEHSINADWFRQIRRVDIEHFGTRKDALAAERRAILEERPRYNTSGALQPAASVQEVLPSRPDRRLSMRFVKGVTVKGFYSDGQGLYLRVDASGAKRFVFVFRHGGKRCEMGMGPSPLITLEAARRECLLARLQLADGRNPIEQRRRDRAAGSKVGAA